MRDSKMPDLQKLCKWWFAKYTDILNGAPAKLPPLREINHHIPLIDEDKQYHYHLPQCPEAMKHKLHHYCVSQRKQERSAQSLIVVNETIIQSRM
jgi:hypothetical protein